MDLRAYLTRHDGKPRPDGPELIRLAGEIGRSSYFLYLAALGHKKFGPAKALELHERSIDCAIDPRTVNSDVIWRRGRDRRWYYREARASA